MEETVSMNVRKASWCLAILIGFCLPLVAQTHKLLLEVPFNFVVAGKTMPAGRYEVKRVWYNDNVTWIVQGEQSGTRIVTTSIESPSVSHSPSLVFIESDGRYALAQIWEGEHSGQAVPGSGVKQAVLAAGCKYFEISIAK